MNDEERRRVLQMLADGKITAEEAADLLDALQAQRERPQDEPISSPPPPRAARSGRALVIRVSEGDTSKVNLRIPLGLARAAGKFIPRKAQRQLGEYGIDLEELLGDLSGTEQGTLLQVEDDDDRVMIVVE